VLQALKVKKETQEPLNCQASSELQTLQNEAPKDPLALIDESKSALIQRKIRMIQLPAVYESPVWRYYYEKVCYPAAEQSSTISSLSKPAQPLPYPLGLVAHAVLFVEGFQLLITLPDVKSEVPL